MYHYCINYNKKLFRPSKQGKNTVNLTSMSKYNVQQLSCYMLDFTDEINYFKLTKLQILHFV